VAGIAKIVKPDLIGISHYFIQILSHRFDLLKIKPAFKDAELDRYPIGFQDFPDPVTPPIIGYVIDDADELDFSIQFAPSSPSLNCG
jgi:hypothetical protein